MPATITVAGVGSATTPEELIALLERAAAHGIHPRRILLALGFRPAEGPAGSAPAP